MKAQIIIRDALIFLLIIILIISKINSCKINSLSKKVLNNDTIVSVIHDTIYKDRTSVLWKIRPETIKVNNPVTIIDTYFVAKEFIGNKYVFKRNFKDTILDFTLIDTVYQNSIISSQYNYSIKRQIVTKTINVKKNRLMVGFNTFIGVKNQSELSISPMVVFSTNKNISLSLQYIPNKNEVGIGLMYNVNK